MIYALIGCLIIIGFLGVKLYQKKTIDTQLINEYQAQVQKVKEQLDSDQKALNQYNSKLVDVRIKVNTEQQKLTDLYNQLDSVETSLKDSRDEYHHLINNKMKEIDETIEEQRRKRQKELDKSFSESKEKTSLQLEQYKKDCEEHIKQYEWEVEQWRMNSEEKIQEYQTLIDEQHKKYLAIQQKLVEQEKEKQARAYYTIQLPEEYRDDIDYLLTSVRPLIRHPDILSKLVWSNYIRPYLDDLCKRADIREEPGIYKITNIDTNKAYIGKSANVKKRIADHMKSVVGVEAIADQAVHHEILKTGFWNWTIEVITYCDKDKLSELEKYYIDFFQTNGYGYNRTGGGEG